jgi:ribosome production factor 1
VKHAKKLQKKKARVSRAREREATGAPRPAPSTQESRREADESVVRPEDTEALEEIQQDLLAEFYKEQREPRVLITTCRSPSTYLKRFASCLCKTIPGARYVRRHRYEVRELTRHAAARGYTDLLILNERAKCPNGLLLCHLPNGPTALFRLSRALLPSAIPGHGAMTSHYPEVLLNNFNTRLGHAVARMLAALFPARPQFQGRRVVTFHNQRDFIFFRQHRYIFEPPSNANTASSSNMVTGPRCRLQELGPRFTLKLRSLLLGPYDLRHGEFEWVHKVSDFLIVYAFFFWLLSPHKSQPDMDTSRRRFFL